MESLTISYTIHFSEMFSLHSIKWKLVHKFQCFAKAKLYRQNYNSIFPNLHLKCFCSTYIRKIRDNIWKIFDKCILYICKEPLFSHFYMLTKPLVLITFNLCNNRFYGWKAITIFHKGVYHSILRSWIQHLMMKLKKINIYTNIFPLYMESTKIYFGVV